MSNNESRNVKNNPPVSVVNPPEAENPHYTEEERARAYRLPEFRRWWAKRKKEGGIPFGTSPFHAFMTDLSKSASPRGVSWKEDVSSSDVVGVDSPESQYRIMKQIRGWPSGHGPRGGGVWNPPENEMNDNENPPAYGAGWKLERRKKYRTSTGADSAPYPEPWSRSKYWRKGHTRDGDYVRGHYMKAPWHGGRSILPSEIPMFGFLHGGPSNPPAYGAGWKLERRKKYRTSTGADSAPYPDPHTRSRFWVKGHHRTGPYGEDEHVRGHYRAANPGGDGRGVCPLYGVEAEAECANCGWIGDASDLADFRSDCTPGETDWGNNPPASGRGWTMERRKKYRTSTGADSAEYPEPHSRSRFWVKGHNRGWHGREHVRGHYRDANPPFEPCPVCGETACSAICVECGTSEHETDEVFQILGFDADGTPIYVCLACAGTLYSEGAEFDFDANPPFDPFKGKKVKKGRCPCCGGAATRRKPTGGRRQPAGERPWLDDGEAQEVSDGHRGRFRAVSEATLAVETLGQGIHQRRRCSRQGTLRDPEPDSRDGGTRSRAGRCRCGW